MDFGLDLELGEAIVLALSAQRHRQNFLIATLLEETPASAGRLQIGSRLKPRGSGSHEALDPSLVLWRHLQDTLSEGRGRDITERARTLLVRSCSVVPRNI